MNRVTSRLRQFLGCMSRQLSSKSTKAPTRNRPFLKLEQLESRDLLATLLPAPSSALVQHPADNPALPAAFDIFNPPVANLVIASAAPQLAVLTSQAKPDDSLAATGYQFSTLAGASAGQDTVFQVYGQTTAANNILSNASIQRLEGDRAAFTLDPGLPSNSMYLVWADNAAGASLPFAVNKTEAWWIGPDLASPGATVSIYGQNLSSGTSTPQSWIYLQPAGGGGQWITPTAVNPYKVDFVVPAGLAAGSYQVWIHNGHGGQYGWSSPVTLTVQAPYNYGHLVVKLSDFGALPNTGTDALPAFLAAMKAIGSNGPATIQLQAGTYYLSDMLSLTAGFGQGVYLQGAGKNVTFLKALPGFANASFLNPGSTSAISDLTVDTTGANLTGQIAVTLLSSMTNVAVISHGNYDFNGNQADHLLIKNSDFVGRGVFFAGANQVIVTGCNFYETDFTDSAVGAWSGSDISVTGCTAQDFNFNSPNSADHGTGRLFWGTGLWGTQSNVYIGDNATNQLSAPVGKGEQITWEGNSGPESSMATSAAANTVTLSSLSGDYKGLEAVVVGGKGTGQHRTIVSTDFAAGGTTLTLDSPWHVTPDATSRINIITIVKQVAIYHNSLQGSSDITSDTTSASQGFEIFNGGLDIYVDQNTMRDFRDALSDYSFGSSTDAVMPDYFNLFQNNTIIDCQNGIRSFDVGAWHGEAADNLGNVYRNNTMSGILEAGWWVLGSSGETMDLGVFEHNQVTDAPDGIQVQLASPSPVYLVVYRNVFNLGAAPAGSQPISSLPGFVELLRSNTYQGYLSGQGATGTLTTLLPTFTWNAIPGATRYDVWVADLTTGQSPVQRDINILGTSWTMTTPLPANHSYRWWVEALDNSGPITPWTSSQDFSLAALSAPGLTLPSGPTPYVGTASLQPAFTWSAVTGADSYDVWINDVTTGQSQVVRQTTTTTYLTPPASLMLGHEYQWWVRALNNNGNASSWSSGTSFAVVLTPPTLLAPTGSLPNAQPTFTWSPVAGANLYDVWVDDTTTGQSQVLRAPLTGTQVVTATSWTAPSALRPGDSYMWWVRALSATGVASSWTTGASFTVALLNAPTLVAPIGTAQNAGLTFQWSSVADYYDVWVDDLTAGTPQALRNTHVTTNTLPVTTLQVGHTYRWWVRAYSNNGNYSAWSASADFTAL